MHDLSQFRLADMIEAGKELRRLGVEATSMEAAAGEVVDFLYECFLQRGNGEHCHVLVRCFKTHKFELLPRDLQAVARDAMNGAALPVGMRCLTLLASRGGEPEWNGRRGSVRHQVIPLPTVQIVADAPMLSRLIRQMGLKPIDVVKQPDELLVDLKEQSFKVFHVEEAVGSEFVPAQESFVLPFGIQSVLGMGGLLPSGELFAVVMFSKVRITRETATMFRTLALSVKLVLLPFSGGRVFAGD